MTQNERRPSHSPYPTAAKLVTPLKMIAVGLMLAAGLLWLVGVILEGMLPRWAIIASAATCAGLLVAYSSISMVTNRRRERRFKDDMAARNARVGEIEATGFTPTFKSIGSSRMFAVDENRGKWYLINYYYHPEKARLHDLSAIVDVSKGKNGDYVPPDQPILMFNGKRLNEKDGREYYEKTGVVIRLSERDCPVEYINCFKTENDADIIISYLQDILDKNRAKQDV